MDVVSKEALIFICSKIKTKGQIAISGCGILCQNQCQGEFALFEGKCYKVGIFIYYTCFFDSSKRAIVLSSKY